MKGIGFTLSIIKQQAHDCPQALLRGWNSLFYNCFLRRMVLSTVCGLRKSVSHGSRDIAVEMAGHGTGGCILWIATSM